jgi:hypothetical protein
VPPAPLCQAISAGGVQKVIELLSNSKEKVDQKWPPVQVQPVHLAAMYSSVEILHLLLEKGADAKAKVRNHLDLQSIFVCSRGCADRPC